MSIIFVAQILSHWDFCLTLLLSNDPRSGNSIPKSAAQQDAEALKSLSKLESGTGLAPNNYSD